MTQSMIRTPKKVKQSRSTRRAKPRAGTKAEAKPVATNEAAASPRRKSSTYGLKALGGIAGPTMRVAAGRKGVADPRLLMNWTEIVGNELAAICQPMKINHGSGMALGGNLILAVDRARASEVEHQLRVVQERVNSFFGYRAVADVRITQTVDIESLRFDAVKFVEKRPEPTSAERKRVAKITAQIESDALKAALSRLGENVIVGKRIGRSKKGDGETT
jgi:hypothetical protein